MSLKKIAEMTGVSASTVSRVLSGSDPKCASQAVRDKIWAAAREISYVPNQTARQLRTGGEKSRPQYRVTVALFRVRALEDDPFFQELYRFVERELMARRCAVTLLTRPTGEDIRGFAQADGVVLLGRCGPEQIEAVSAYNKNVVGLWRNPMEGLLDQVYCSGEKAAFRAVEYLAGLGHRRIAYIGDCSAEGRFVGYTKALLAQGIPLRMPLVYETDQTAPAGRRAMEKLAAAGQATAALCANDATALGALEALAGQRGRKAVPISVISIDNIEASAWAKPMLTTMNIPRRDMAHLGVGILLDRMEKGHGEYVSLELPSRLMERDSCYVCR